MCYRGVNIKAQKPWWHCQGCMLQVITMGFIIHDLVLQLKYFTIIMHKPQPSIQKSIVRKTCQVSSIGSCQCEIEPYNHEIENNLTRLILLFNI